MTNDTVGNSSMRSHAWTKFSRASVSAAKRCSGAARDVEIIAMTDVKRIPDDIKNVLLTSSPRISVIADYAFSGKGKMLRPLLVLLMAACANGHNDYSIITSDNPTPVLMFSDRHLKNTVTDAQHAIAVIAEMIHTASLIHDDLIDKAEMRRKKLATYRKFGSKDAVLVGNVTLLKASELLAKVGDAEVVSVLSTVLDDLIRGEFMQLTSNSDENYRFHLYLEKTYKKTASLIANSCKAVTILSKVGDALAESAYAFGRHLGMAFQLLDDVLDFVGQEDKLGKPAGGSDLQLGLATGPVLFAAQQFPELERMLQTGFRTPEDQKKALEFIHESNGVGQTRMLAEFHFQEAQRQLGHFKASDARKCLLQVAATTLLRSF
uniref:Decaprenyl diphosphate synthase subunit 1 n=1 Tax=Echinococcus granulosus TaxID=6210 RepID=A0A068WKR0_ECHGR|nr:decaprenyl diphosphate synthase subunit 1 [Echinococcus granulosus]